MWLTCSTGRGGKFCCKKSLEELLNEENQKTIAAALRKYQAGEGSRMEEFYQILNSKIEEKQNQYDALMQNLSSSALPADVVSDIGKRMTELKEEIEILKNTEAPKDFTVETIQSWLNNLKHSADRDAIKLLIERIDVELDENEKTVFNITSTLNTVVRFNWLRGQDLNLRPSGYEPDELPAAPPRDI